ncbi:MAG: LysR family transcriptional regulator [Pseudomonadota bacterium]
MNIERVDLNLLVYLDVLLTERNVSRSAEQLGITQPAMSNGLKRLRNLFDDPILVRTSEGMVPTKRALELQPIVREMLTATKAVLQPISEFNPEESKQTFHIMASDYIEATLIAPLIQTLRQVAPKITLDILTPSDVTFHDIEQGKVDLAINRFNQLPQSFHQNTIWRDGFSCLMNKNHPNAGNFTLDTYLESEHIWVSKTGMGAGTGMDRSNTQKLGWVDEALAELNVKRDIRLFTRHYHVAPLLTQNSDLVVTMPTRAALIHKDNPDMVIIKAPFLIIPIELTMAWSPLLQHNPAHKWMRRLIIDVAKAVNDY